MLDHDVFAVVRVAGNGTDMHNFSIGNGAHFVQRFTMCIAVHGPNIDPFMKTGINDATRRVLGSRTKPYWPPSHGVDFTPL